jgi:hypothetical protein
MINNSIVIALAIISVVCVYLIWENFKIRSKMKYLEASVHETIQTVQAMINTPFQHPPLQQQYSQPHPHPQVPPKQEQSQPQQQQSHQQSQPEQQQENKMMGGGFLQNIISNIMKTVEQAAPMFDNGDLESVTDESTTEEDNKIEELEPLDITEELKKEINDLTFTEAEEKIEDLEDVDFEPKIEELEDDENIEDLEDIDVDNFESKIEELEDEVKVEEVKVEEVKVEEVKVEEVKVEEVKEDEMINDIEDLGDLEMSNEDADSYLTNPDVLGYLSLKQLQDIAEKNKLGKRGTKEQLITRIKRNMKLVK